MKTLLNAPPVVFAWARRVLHFLAASIYLLAGGILLGLLGGAVLSISEPQLYRSTAIVSLEPQVFNQNTMLSMEALVSNYGLRLQSERRIAQVVEVEGWTDSVPDVARHVTVDADPEAFTLTIHVWDRSSEHAAEIADALVRTFHDDVEAANLRRARQDRIRLNVLQPPAPGIRDSPHWNRNLEGGALAGLGAGLLVALWWAWRRRDRVYDPLEVEGLIGAPTLGKIPR